MAFNVGEGEVSIGADFSRAYQDLGRFTEQVARGLGAATSGAKGLGAQARQSLQPLIRGGQEATQAMQGVGQASQTTTQQIRQGFVQAIPDLLKFKNLVKGGLTFAFSNILAGGIYQSLTNLKAFVSEVVLGTARIKQMDEVLAILGKRQGFTRTEIGELTKEIEKQGITTTVAQNTLQEFIRYNLDLAAASKVARVAQDAAVLSNSNSSATLQRVIYGISRQNSLILRNAGLQVQVGQAIGKYAAQLGLAADELDSTQRTQAVLNAVLEEGEKIAGAYEASLTQPLKKLGSLERIVDTLQSNLGEELYPAFQTIVNEGIDPFVKGLERATREGTLFRDEWKEFGTVLDGIANSFLDIFTDEAIGTGGPVRTIRAELEPLVDLFKDLVVVTSDFISTLLESGGGMTIKLITAAVDGLAGALEFLESIGIKARVVLQTLLALKIAKWIRAITMTPAMQNAWLNFGVALEGIRLKTSTLTTGFGFLNLKMKAAELAVKGFGFALKTALPVLALTAVLEIVNKWSEAKAEIRQRTIDIKNALAQSYDSAEDLVKALNNIVTGEGDFRDDVVDLARVTGESVDTIIGWAREGGDEWTAFTERLGEDAKEAKGIIDAWQGAASAVGGLAFAPPENLDDLQETVRLFDTLQGIQENIAAESAASVQSLEAFFFDPQPLNLEAARNVLLEFAEAGEVAFGRKGTLARYKRALGDAQAPALWDEFQKLLDSGAIENEVELLQLLTDEYIAVDEAQAKAGEGTGAFSDELDAGAESVDGMTEAQKRWEEQTKKMQAYKGLAQSFYNVIDPLKEAPEQLDVSLTKLTENVKAQAEAYETYYARLEELPEGFDNIKAWAEQQGPEINDLLQEIIQDPEKGGELENALDGWEATATGIAATIIAGIEDPEQRALIIDAYKEGGKIAGDQFLIGMNESFANLFDYEYLADLAGGLGEGNMTDSGQFQPPVSEAISSRREFLTDEDAAMLFPPEPVKKAAEKAAETAADSYAKATPENVVRLVPMALTEGLTAPAMLDAAFRSGAKLSDYVVMGLNKRLTSANFDLPSTSFTPTLPGAVGMFDIGGNIPGIRGAPTPIMAHAGEVVIPSHRKPIEDILADAMSSATVKKGSGITVVVQQPVVSDLPTMTARAMAELETVHWLEDFD